MKTYLRIGSDYLDDAKRYRSKKAAIAEFKHVASELARYEQRIDASLHYARNYDELHEYPDFVLSLGPRGGVKIERA
jgi:hypothetical protein